MHNAPLPTPESALALLRARRTVKPPLFDGRVIDKPVVESLLEAATWAPTHGMNQPWRFRVYAGAALPGLETVLAGLFEGLNPPDERREEKLRGVRRNVTASSHAITVFLDRGNPGKIPYVEDVAAVACAVQNLQLAARAHGLGAFWSTNTVDYTTPPTVLFPGVPATWRYLGVVFLGYPRGDFPASSRKPLGEVVEWVKA